MFRAALVYLACCAACWGLMALARLPRTPAVALLPFLIYPDLLLMFGAGRLDTRQTWVCRFVGLAAVAFTLYLGVRRA